MRDNGDREDSRPQVDALEDREAIERASRVNARRASRRKASLLVIAAGAGAFLLFGPKLPRDQSVRILLGDRAPIVRELVLRYEPAGDASGAGKSASKWPRWTQALGCDQARQGEQAELTGELLREVSFRYPNGGAPRLVHHEARLADGDYVLEMEVVTDQHRTSVKRTVGLLGGTTTIDLSNSFPMNDPAPRSTPAADALDAATTALDAAARLPDAGPASPPARGDEK